MGFKSRLRRIFRPFYLALVPFNATHYWQKRYANGGNSGDGSYGELAKFKADVINSIVEKHKIQSVADFGCGDGNQLSLLKIPRYTGLDVSEKAIQLCKHKFAGDPTKSFRLYDSKYKHPDAQSEASISLDVIYHLVNDPVFEKYMTDLITSATRFVIIYSSNTNEQTKNRPAHLKQRKFSDWIDRNHPELKLIEHIPNPHPFANGCGSISDFYIYQKAI
ncbi:MAG TPA: class I SAM-dependent methyltransferase [Candidatus Kryptonia bacterium]